MMSSLKTMVLKIEESERAKALGGFIEIYDPRPEGRSNFNLTGSCPALQGGVKV
jgi:hypothetical protein